MNWKNWLQGLVLAVLTGIGTGIMMIVADPAHYNFGEHWHDLLNCSIGFGLVAFFAYLRDSRPPTWQESTPTLEEMKKNAGVGVLILASALALSACSATQYHQAVVADTGLSQALFALDDAESAAFKAQLITPAKHAIYGAAILKLLKAGEDLTQALKAWDPAQPAPTNIGAALNEVQVLLADLKIDSPKASQAIFAAETVLSVLRGSGVLPSARRIQPGLSFRPWASVRSARCELRAATLAHDDLRLRLHVLILLPEVARG